MRNLPKQLGALKSEQREEPSPRISSEFPNSASNSCRYRKSRQVAIELGEMSTFKVLEISQPIGARFLVFPPKLPRD